MMESCTSWFHSYQFSCRLAEKTRKLSSKESSEILGRSTGVAEKLWGPNRVSETDISDPLSPHEKTKTEQQGQVLVPNQEEGKCQVDDSSPNATTVTKPDHTLSIPLDVKDGRKQVKSEVKVTSVPSGQEIGDHQGVQSFEKIGLQGVKQDTNPTFARVVSTSCDSMSSANSELRNQQERRLVLLSIRTPALWSCLTICLFVWHGRSKSNWD